MPRRIIKKYMPDPKKLQEQKSLRFLGKLLDDPGLLHLTRRSVATAFMVGIFCAFIPVPFQMVLAAAGAMLLHCNLPISVGLVWITNPVTMPVMFYGTYLVGAWILGVEAKPMPDELTLEWLGQLLNDAWIPLYLGSVIIGIMMAILSNIGIRLLWRWHVSKSWNRRKRRMLILPEKKQDIDEE
ncbi:DUF2062 domain-containing protein [Oceanospirillum linum]|uniref:ATP-binding protein n=1 Tax=Oceanospirillum linum TaxID=966 RepID=A0A1T1HGN0_OCELI|nr:DUF2062 domain-containing protein [Oceanospirillum linum]OOV88910.1 ATP-binding protein [Oceanospirillum linum]